METQKILIIEDEGKIADTLQQSLLENGYLADVAYDGDTGLSLFRVHHYDLIILDINLPGKNGYELCKEFRSVNQDVPIIFLTALIGFNDKAQGYNSGADEYVVKPFEFKELLLKIKVFLKRNLVTRQDNKNCKLKAGDLELNLETKTVIRNNKAISLTTKEFQLLEYLLRNKNKILSRSEIAHHVWEIDFDTNTNVIDVYINYLRNKVDKDFDSKLIKTQVGMGYILKD